MISSKAKDNDFLKAVACRADELIMEQTIGEMPSFDELKEKYTFSEDFEQKMQSVISRVGRRGRTSASTKRILALVAAISALIIGAMAVGANWESIYRFALTYDEGGFVDVDYDRPDDYIPTSMFNIETFYEPTYLPDDFVETERKQEHDELDIEYRNSDGKIIYYSQNSFSTHYVYGIDTEVKEIYTGEYHAYYGYSRDGTVFLFLNYNDECQLHIIGEIITLEEAIMILNSLEPQQ